MSLCNIRQAGPVNLLSCTGSSRCGAGDKRLDAASGPLQSSIGGIHLSLLLSVGLKERFKTCVASVLPPKALGVCEGGRCLPEHLGLVVPMLLAQPPQRLWERGFGGIWQTSVSL